MLCRTNILFLVSRLESRKESANRNPLLKYSTDLTQAGLIYIFLYDITMDLQFTEFVEGVMRIPLRIWRMSPVVVVDDVSPVVRTGDVDRVRYRGSGVDGVSKTEHSVLFVCCVGDVN